jgi:hypothetical protein
MRSRHVERHGRYYRVCDPHWEDCCDTSFSKAFGGRWNPRGAFGVLYLCQTLVVAAANARQNFVGEIHSLYDLKPEFRPIVLEFGIGRAPERRFVDAVSDAGLSAVGLPATYPFSGKVRVPYSSCRQVGKAAYAAAERGIACRSAAEASVMSWLGEELALFDRSVAIARRGRRRAFADWYAAARQ